MSLLSREIARWLTTHPGLVFGEDEAEAYEKARAMFMMARRWKKECPMDVFMVHLRSLGHMPTSRINHDTGKSLVCLQFSERPVGH